MTSFVFYTNNIYLWHRKQTNNIKKKVILSQEYKKSTTFFYPETCSVFSYINNFE